MEPGWQCSRRLEGEGGRPGTAGAARAGQGRGRLSWGLCREHGPARTSLLDFRPLPENTLLSF